MEAPDCKVTCPLINARAELSAGVNLLLIPPLKFTCYQGQVTALRCFKQRLLQAVQCTTIQGKHPKNNQVIKPVGNAAINPITPKSSPVKGLQ